MKLNIRNALYLLPLLAAIACDTTEEGYWPGAEPTDVISANVAEIHLNADGTAQDLNITAICAWDASLADNENVFSISPASGKGNGTIAVSAQPNYGSAVKTSTLTVKAQNFPRQVTVNVMQSTLVFEMDEKEYPTVGEEGGSVELEFRSTTGWELSRRANSADPNDLGDLGWLSFTPGMSGEGDFYDTKVSATWTPNRTGEERVITLVLTPSNQDILQYLTGAVPQPFTLRQAAGTLPTAVSGNAITIGKTEISYALTYSSKTEVTDCGVRVLTLSGEEVKTVSGEKTNGTYPTSGQVNVAIGGLQEGTAYRLVPYVKNLVGEATGTALDVTTDADIVYRGVTITNYELITTARSVTARVTVDSDIDVTEVGMSIYNDYYREQPLVTYTQPTAGYGKTFTVDVSSTDFMSPNSEAEVVVFARTSVNEVRTERLTFRTKSLLPGEEDNNLPEVSQ